MVYLIVSWYIYSSIIYIYWWVIGKIVYIYIYIFGKEVMVSMVREDEDIVWFVRV